MKKDLYYIVFAISLLALAALACGSSNEGTVVTPDGEAERTAEVSPGTEMEPTLDTETEPTQETEDLQDSEASTDQVGDADAEPVDEDSPAFEIYSVGDLVEVNDHTIRLNSVAYQGDVLAANFTLENNGTSDLNVSSIISFSAKTDDGTQLELEIFDCGASSLDGSVIPGDRLRGDICWNGASPEDGVRLYYADDLFGQGAIVWDAIEGTAEEVASTPDSGQQIEVFDVGEVVQVQDHTIRLNNVEYRGSVVAADFTVENTGTSDENISSMLLFSAKRDDGTRLEQEIFDCGASSLDGQILAGDRLKGEICWNGANEEDGIRIYYEADLIGEGAVVWEATTGTAEPIEWPDAELNVDTFSVGDLIELQDHSIVLNSTDFQGDVLRANFTLENSGSSDLVVSSILSFYARTRDGSSLEEEIFDCGSLLDGTVIPGDRVTGDLCWVGAGPEDGVKIYYEAELFDSGAVVWVPQDIQP